MSLPALPKKIKYNLPWIVWSLLILYVLIIRVSDIPRFRLPLIEHADKIVHAFLFFVLSLLVLRAVFFLKTGSIYFTKHILPVLLLCFCYGGFTEVLQYVLPTGRQADWRDFAADSTGILLGSVLFVLLNRKKLQNNTENQEILNKL